MMRYWGKVPTKVFEDVRSNHGMEMIVIVISVIS